MYGDNTLTRVNLAHLRLLLERIYGVVLSPLKRQRNIGLTTGDNSSGLRSSNIISSSRWIKVLFLPAVVGVFS